MKNTKSRNKPSKTKRLSRKEKTSEVRSTVQFRTDEETMLRIMSAADDKKVPLGTLVRMWMVERLEQEGY